MTIAVFPIDESYLLAGWLESFFWGLYTLLFGMTVYAIFKRRRHGINKFTTATIILLYILATIHMALALVRLVQGFIYYRDTITPALYFADISVRLNMAKDYIYITNLVVGDLVVVWRLYVVWGRNLWIAALPIAMGIGEFVAGYGSISQWLLPSPDPATMVRWGTAMFAMSLATNILVTSAIVLRIWYVTMHTREVLTTNRNARNARVVLLIVESGVLIAAAKLTEFILFQLAPVDGLDGLNALYIVYEAMPQITGIAPTVIVWAVNQGFTLQDDDYTNTIVLGTRSGAWTNTVTRDSSLVTYMSMHDDVEARSAKRLPNRLDETAMTYHSALAGEAVVAEA